MKMMKNSFTRIGFLIFFLGASLIITGIEGYTMRAHAQEGKQEEKPAPENEAGKEKPGYQDPATCAALLNDQSYKGMDAQKYMVAGKDSWVFRSRQDLKTDFSISEEDLALYQKFSAFLKESGMELVLVYIPTRGMIASKFLRRESEWDKNFDIAAAAKSYNATIKAMRDKGIHIIGNSNPQSPESYFNHADQHWTTSGARAMAEKTAAYIKANIPIASKLPQVKFETTVGKKVTYDGRFGEIIKKICKFRPDPETDLEVYTKPAGLSDDAALFGDVPIPLVTLVGTSNSRREEFNSNFDGYLKQELSLDILNAAIAGGGMDDSLLIYLTSSEFKKNPPRILIWEIPGYYDLGGANMRQTIRQAMASVAGYCEKPLAEFSKKTIEDKKLKIFDKVEKEKIPAKNAYIVLNFDEEVTKDFTMSVKTDDGKHEKYEFQRRKGDDGRLWYYLPKQNRDGFFAEATISVNDGIKGRHLQARLCPLVP